MYPRLFQIGPLALPTYGVLTALGILLALYCAMRLARLSRLDPNSIWNLGLLMVVCALVGSKLILIATHWSDFRAQPLWMLGLAASRFGNTMEAGIALACAAGLLFIWVARLPLLRTLDVVAPALALGMAIDKLGCFAAGCCYGTETSLRWGVTYSSRLAAAWAGTPLGVRVHPTQLYEAAVQFALFGLLLWLLERHLQDGRGQEGDVFGAWLFVGGLASFLFEYLRGDAAWGEIPGGMVTISQLIALVMVVAGALLWRKRDTVESSAYVV